MNKAELAFSRLKELVSGAKANALIAEEYPAGTSMADSLNIARKFIMKEPTIKDKASYVKNLLEDSPAFEETLKVLGTRGAIGTAALGGLGLGVKSTFNKEASLDDYLAGVQAENIRNAKDARYSELKGHYSGRGPDKFNYDPNRISTVLKYIKNNPYKVGIGATGGLGIAALATYLLKNQKNDRYVTEGSDNWMPLDQDWAFEDIFKNSSYYTKPMPKELEAVAQNGFGDYLLKNKITGELFEYWHETADKDNPFVKAKVIIKPI